MLVLGSIACLFLVKILIFSAYSCAKPFLLQLVYFYFHVMRLRILSPLQRLFFIQQDVNPATFTHQVLTCLCGLWCQCQLSFHCWTDLPLMGHLKNPGPYLHRQRTYWELRNSLGDAVLSPLSVTHLGMFKNWVPYCSSEKEARPSVSTMLCASLSSTSHLWGQVTGGQLMTK